MFRKFAVAALICAGTAHAHVTVAPAVAPPSAFQRYTIVVPSEKPIATIKLEMQFPDALRVREVEALAGWRATVAKNSKGGILGAVWEGGNIPSGQFAKFGVIARNPETEGELTWKAIQTYQDGSEVQWIGGRGAQFPAMVTQVRSAAEGSASADRVLLWTAVILALAALIVAGLGWQRAGKH